MDPEEVSIYGVRHKIGDKGFVYMRIDNDWVRSNKTVEEFERRRTSKGRGRVS